MLQKNRLRMLGNLQRYTEEFIVHMFIFNNIINNNIPYNSYICYYLLLGWHSLTNWSQEQLIFIFMWCCGQKKERPVNNYFSIIIKIVNNSEIFLLIFILASANQSINMFCLPSKNSNTPSDTQIQFKAAEMWQMWQTLCNDEIHWS